MQGFRDAMEDRTLCIDTITIPLGKMCPSQSDSDMDRNCEVQRSAEAWGLQPDQLDIRAFAVFDGHGGAEASEFAARLIRLTLEAELLATFVQDRTLCDLSGTALSAKQFLSKKELSPESAKILETVSKALEQALLKLDADFEAFAVSEGIDAGTTACVAVLVGNRWLQVRVICRIQPGQHRLYSGIRLRCVYLRISSVWGDFTRCFVLVHEVPLCILLHPRSLFGISYSRETRQDHTSYERVLPERHALQCCLLAPAVTHSVQSFHVKPSISSGESEKNQKELISNRFPRTSKPGSPKTHQFLTGFSARSSRLQRDRALLSFS